MCSALHMDLSESVAPDGREGIVLAHRQCAVLTELQSFSSLVLMYKKNEVSQYVHRMASEYSTGSRPDFMVYCQPRCSLTHPLQQTEVVKAELKGR